MEARLLGTLGITVDCTGMHNARQKMQPPGNRWEITGKITGRKIENETYLFLFQAVLVNMWKKFHYFLAILISTMEERVFFPHQNEKINLMLRKAGNKQKQKKSLSVVVPPRQTWLPFVCIWGCPPTSLSQNARSAPAATMLFHHSCQRQDSRRK